MRKHNGENVNCLICNKEFYVNPGVANSGRKYCSTTCQHKSMIRKETLPCKNCGKEIEKRESSIKNSVNNFCSNKCKAKYNNKPKRVKISCSLCGKETERIASRINKEFNFCSPKCRNYFKKGKPLSEEHKKKLRECIRPIMPPEHYIKIGLSQRGKKHSEETKRKISIAGKGKPKPPRSEEHKRKLGLANSGPNSALWKGGISTEPYCCVWTKEYKEEIKERDGYKCLNPMCNHNSKRLAVHHIDYNKKNCHPKNLISICTSCNSKANIDREWHTSFYQEIIRRIYLKAA